MCERVDRTRGRGAIRVDRSPTQVNVYGYFMVWMTIEPPPIA
jgi:hypothetical protein